MPELSTSFTQDVATQSGPPHTDYSFTDASYGDSTQLLYLRARYYNPADGRFQSRDTWGGDVRRPVSLNRWNYVEANSINLTDPSGHDPWWCDTTQNPTQCITEWIKARIGISVPSPISTPTPDDCPPIPTTGVVPPNLGTEADFFTPVADGKDAFLQAVLRHQNELPYGMSVKLLLAMGAAESGEGNGWCQECLNGGGPLNSGVLQMDNLTYKWKSGTPPYNWYNNSATGYDNNVRDAIAFLKAIANNIAVGNGREGVERIFGPLPSGDSIKLMLYYNGGDSNPIDEYRAGGGNRYYLSQTAPFLINSPFGCSYNDPILAADLIAAQPILTHRIDHPEEP